MTEEQKAKHREAVKRYRLRNAERLKEMNRMYRSSPEAKERHRIYNKKWRKENPEKALEISRKSWRLHGKKINEKRKIKYKTDPEYRKKVAERERRYKESGRRAEVNRNNPNTNKRSKEYRKNNPDKIRKKQKEYRKNVQILKERKWRKKLSDEYVVAVIKKQFDYQIKTSDIPKELIKAKRLIIKTKRL